MKFYNYLGRYRVGHYTYSEIFKLQLQRMILLF